ncbi:unnamed protein product [Mycena citricolor]|uniref:Pre-rRNA-processing protein IPI3 n=1 Tax=Mycena citricolor TaxID=2018698 RepID=A0AAD2Q251_9AGAR|nr:unnamed protein product [Mycena citricolor]
MSSSSSSPAAAIALPRPATTDESARKPPVWSIDQTATPSQEVPPTALCARHNRPDGVCCKELKGDDRTLINPEIVRDIVIGLSDGLTVPFALTAGLSSLGESRLVVLGGVAELIAAERDHYRFQRTSTAARVVRSCDGEMEREVSDVLGPIGVDAKTCRAVARCLRDAELPASSNNSVQAHDLESNDSLRWSKEVGLTPFLLKFGEGLEEVPTSRLYSSAATIGAGYLIGGIIPLIPYFFIPRASIALMWCHHHWSRLAGAKGYVWGAVSTLLVGGVAAAAAFGIVRALEGQDVFCILSWATYNSQALTPTASDEIIHDETILCGVTPAAGPGSIAFHDLKTGSTLASFKQTTSALHSTAVVQTRDGQGGLLFAAQQDKSIMNVYNFQKVIKSTISENIVPEGLLKDASTFGRSRPDTVQFLGRALPSSYRAEIHPRRRRACVWQLLDDDVLNDLPLPYCVLSDHTLPVTDIACGIGAFPRCRILSASVDHSLWDLASQSLLTTFQFPQPISCLAWDATERLFFAASKDGSIHQMNLFKQREDKSGAARVDAIGGAGVTDIIRAGEEDTRKAQKRRLISVGEPVLSIAISLTSTLLLAGTSTGLIHIYDIPSHQLLRSVSTHKGSSITQLATLLKPPDLIGHVSLSLQAGTSSMVPVRHVAPFQRMKDAKARETREVTMTLSTPAKDESVLYSPEALLRDHEFFVKATGGGDTVSLQSKVTELESEVARLREQLGKAKGINDAIWETVVHKVVKPDAVSGEPQRKRGRTDDT